MKQTGLCTVLNVALTHKLVLFIKYVVVMTLHAATLTEHFLFYCYWKQQNRLY